MVKEAPAGYIVDDAQPALVETIEVERLPATEARAAEHELQPSEVPSTADATVEEVPVEVETSVAAPAAVEETVEPVETAPSAPVAFPGSDSAAGFPFVEEPAAIASSPDNSVAFPASPDSSAPVAFAFPGSDTSLTNTPALSGTATPGGVTFQNMPSPGRSGTPEVDQDGKRRTLSTQGMQRLARRLSVSGRRETSSTSIPKVVLNAFKRENSSISKDKGDKDTPKNDSKDNLAVREDGSLVAAESTSKDSPNASVASNIDEPKSKKSKKEKKEKKKKSMGPA